MPIAHEAHNRYRNRVEDSMVKYLLLFVVCSTVCTAASLDTLRTYRNRGGYVYYTEPGITMQAARFELMAPGALRAVTILLSGGPGQATLHVFGHEGGLPAPGVGRDMVAPIIIRKTRAGVERIVVELPRPVKITSSQFFVAVDNLTPGVLLLSDRNVVRPACVSGAERFTAQLLRTRKGAWKWGEYAYMVDAVVEYDIRRRSSEGLVDNSVALGFPDSVVRHQSIAWADINHDGYSDVLVDGRLYRNDRGERFTEITATAGLHGTPRAGIFIDADNDAAPDILFLGLDADNNGDAVRTLLYRNTGSGGYVATATALPAIANPVCASVADADGDGLLDVFVGQGAGKDSRMYLLQNSGGGEFTDATAMLGDRSVWATASSGSQWVDADADGDLDLFVAGADGVQDRLWQRRTDGTYSIIAGGPAGGGDADFDATGARVGCHWADYDNDGDMDLLLPGRSSVAAARGNRGGTFADRPVLRRVSAERNQWRSQGEFEYEEGRAGGAWGDANNDGYLDMFLTTSCGCRYASFYEGAVGGGFSNRGDDYGISRLAAGADALWVDYDNDGRLDLATFVDGRFALLHNTRVSTNAYADIELVGGDAIGARVDLYAGGRRYTAEVNSGRGMLMQEPARLHFGLGAARAIDSAVVRRANGHTETYRDLATNTLNRLGAGGGNAAAGAVLNVAAAPNPFAEHVQISYLLTAGQPLRLAIYSIDGALIRTLVDERQDMGAHVATWNGDDQYGHPVGQGTYVYRLNSGGGEIVGKVSLVR